MLRPSHGACAPILEGRLTANEIESLCLRCRRDLLRCRRDLAITPGTLVRRVRARSEWIGFGTVPPNAAGTNRIGVRLENGLLEIARQSLSISRRKRARRRIRSDACLVGSSNGRDAVLVCSKWTDWRDAGWGSRLEAVMNLLRVERPF